jgi:MFS family permease
MNAQSNTKALVLLAIGFALGIALMGFQMVATKLLTPFLGSGIEVWPAVISTTMLSLMVGYYVGGMVADRAPRSEVLGVAVLVAGGLLALVPTIKDPILYFLMEQLGDNLTVNAIVAAMALMVAPLTLMSFFSPFAVRLLLADAQHGGRVAGSVYSITTVGNIIGTLGGAHFLGPTFGSLTSTYIYAGIVAACGLGLIGLRMRASADASA